MGRRRYKGPAHLLAGFEALALARENGLEPPVLEDGDLVLVGVEDEDTSVLGAVENDGSAEHRHVLHRFEVGRGQKCVAERRQEPARSIENMEDLPAVRADGDEVLRARAADRGDHEVRQERPDEPAVRAVHDDLAHVIDEERSARGHGDAAEVRRFLRALSGGHSDRPQMPAVWRADDDLAELVSRGCRCSLGRRGRPG
jgi:hypothetical protein